MGNKTSTLSTSDESGAKPAKRNERSFHDRDPDEIQVEDTTKPLKIKIRITPANRQLTLHENIRCYNTFGPKRCKALIINNAESASRLGADVDMINLFKLFKKLKFSIRTYNNLKSGELIKCIHSFAKDPDLQDYDMCFVVVLGKAKSTTDNKLVEISAACDQYVAILDILQHFSDEKCPQLKDKPKLFMFQGNKSDSPGQQIENDVRRRHLKDMFIANSLLIGKLQKQTISSYYVQALCKVFMAHACDTDFEAMIQKVEQIVYKHDQSSQHTFYDNIQFGKCYLNPVPIYKNKCLMIV